MVTMRLYEFETKGFYLCDDFVLVKRNDFLFVIFSQEKSVSDVSRV